MQGVEKVAAPEGLAARPTIPELAAWFGLAGGFLDLVGLVIRKSLIQGYVFYFESRHFLWTVPLSNLVLLLVVGLSLWGLGRLGARRAAPELAARTLAILAVLGFLLRMPLDWWASLLLAVGVGVWLGDLVPRRPRVVRWGLAGLSVALGGLVVASIVGTALLRHRTLAGLPTPPPAGRNVLLVVLDDVRAESLSLYGYRRDTTPNLRRWAARGATFEHAIAPAPWTFPSHACFLTGQWPYKFNTDWKHALDATFPTLAEYLSARGWLTGAFVSNTVFCGYETGLNRGFLDFEDYVLSPLTILASGALGRKLVEAALGSGDLYARKWLKFQSRDARQINRDFLAWVARPRPSGRPFFAFLNYMDAHEPFVPQPGQGPRFGLTPATPEEAWMIFDWWNVDKRRLSPRDLALARDAYDDCIADLDRRVGELLDELDRRGLLESTMVIITSDHGEHLGEHQLFNHGSGLYLPEIRVPLLILAPNAEPGRRVDIQVSLRDLTATVIDFLDVEDRSILPGRSLASNLRAVVDESPPETSPALSEIQGPYLLTPQAGRHPALRGTTFSLVEQGKHYLRYETTTRLVEEVYDLATDPSESRDLAGSLQSLPILARFRATLDRVFLDDPVRNGRSGMISAGLRDFLTRLAQDPR